MFVCVCVYVCVCYLLRKRMMAEAKTLIKSNISTQMAQVPFFYSLTLTLIFKVSFDIFIVLRMSRKR